MPSKSICTSMYQEKLHKLQIPTLKQQFSSQNKTEGDHHACLAKQCAIQLMKNNCTSSKFQLARARIFHHEIKQRENTMRA